MAAFCLMKIRALRDFSHYHAGNFSSGDVRVVPQDVAEALIGLELAAEVQEDDAASKPQKAAKSGGKGGNNPGKSD